LLLGVFVSALLLMGAMACGLGGGIDLPSARGDADPSTGDYNEPGTTDGSTTGDVNLDATGGVPGDDGLGGANSGGDSGDGSGGAGSGGDSGDGSGGTGSGGDGSGGASSGSYSPFAVGSGGVLN